MRLHNKQSGFTLIEVMISVFIISFGILGMASMQITSKRVGLDALQRSIAVTAAHDILERMAANKVLVDSYAGFTVGGGTITTEPNNCRTGICTAGGILLRDMWEWEQALDGGTEVFDDNGTDVSVGGLINPKGCITQDATTGIVTVTVAWETGQKLKNEAGIDTSDSYESDDYCGEGLYGTDDEQRASVFLTTYI